MGRAYKEQAVVKRKPRVKPGPKFTYRSVDDKDVFELIDAVRQGISYPDFEKIYKGAPFLLSEWANFLQISERTIQRNEKEKKGFQPIQSERIIDIAMLYQYGLGVFDDKENLDIWLNSRSIALGGRTPRELLDTRWGVGMVKDELGRIEQGIFA